MSYIQHKSEESTEDYLETILVLNNELPEVRSIDIANEMSFSKPSVSVAMKNLKEKDYIDISPEGYITLTPDGQELAEDIYERHRLFTDWLVSMGVSPETAAEDACRMEHDISQESFNAIKEHIKEHHPEFAKDVTKLNS